MIVSSYSNFINENQIWALIKEAKLMASDNFLDRLKSMPDNQIAKTLYSAFVDNRFIDKNLNYNWIDVTEQDGMITFTSDRNADRFNNDPSQIWTSKRQPYSVGKLARAILPDIGYKISGDKEIEEFVNLYKASKQDTSKKFELISGPTLRNYYLVDSYADTTGTLGKSCMRYEKCQTFFKLYSRNSDVCRLLVYSDENNKVIGRALVWKLQKSELFEDYNKPYDTTPEYFMDRIYSTTESDVIKFLDYAKKNNWLTKYKMSASNEESLQFLHNGKWLFGRVIVKLPRLHFDSYPYVDTLKFSDGDSLISNVGFFVDLTQPDYDLGSVLNNTDGRATYCSCGGTGHDSKQDSKCKKCKGKKETRCDKCGGTNLITCNDCSGRGKIECDRCVGNGVIRCIKCNGDGKVNCSNCEGSGTSSCQICQGVGNLGTCDECEEGQVKCSVCNDEPVVCSGCEGEGTVLNDDDEFVPCKRCRGAGSAREGTRLTDGCRCPECSVDLRGNRWKNKGRFSCSKCEGTQILVCPMDCDSGQVHCDNCFGRGKVKCNNCGPNGNIKCPKCSGAKHLGNCTRCNGVGNLGSCSCNNGRIPCSDCNATGIRGKLSEEYKCADCAGLLEDFIAKKYPQSRIN